MSTGIAVHGAATAEEIAAVLAVLMRHAVPRPLDNYEKWRRARQIVVAQAMH